MEQLELFPDFDWTGSAAAQPATQPASVWRDLAEAAQHGAQIVLLCDPWPDFDPNDPKFFTPDADGYIEAERLPPEWLAMVGRTVCADRRTVGTIADLLEELPPDIAEEWRQHYDKADTDVGSDALTAWEEAHHICWFGEGYYIDDEEEEAATAI